MLNRKLQMCGILIKRTQICVYLFRPNNKLLLVIIDLCTCFILTSGVRFFLEYIHLARQSSIYGNLCTTLRDNVLLFVDSQQKCVVLACIRKHLLYELLMCFLAFPPIMYDRKDKVGSIFILEDVQCQWLNSASFFAGNEFKTKHILSMSSQACLQRPTTIHSQMSGYSQCLTDAFIWFAYTDDLWYVGMFMTSLRAQKHCM